MKERPEGRQIPTERRVKNHRQESAVGEQDEHGRDARLAEQEEGQERPGDRVGEPAVHELHAFEDEAQAEPEYESPDHWPARQRRKPGDGPGDTHRKP